jgi:hypothetical protein
MTGSESYPTKTGHLLACGLLYTILFGGFAPAAEVYSNGAGGGAWSDPGTWRGKAVPGADDDVVIARNDVVVFDRDDDRLWFPETAAGMAGALRPLDACAALLVGAAGKASCRKLSIDPRGAFTFKPGGGKLTFCASGSVESFGTVKLDARETPGDRLEFRLTGAKAEDRVMQFKKGGALLVHGRANPAGGRSNVALVSLPQPAFNLANTDPAVLGLVEGEAGVIMDVHGAELADVLLKAGYIDNTSAKPNERINVAGCRFTRRSRIQCLGCDTPLIADNTFAYGGADTIAAPALNVYASPLAEVRGNTIRGRYDTGIMGQAQTDSIVSGNTVEKCSTGIYWYGENGMLKQNAVRDCATGVTVTSMSGALEDITVDGCQVGYYHGGATTQVTTLRVLNLRKDGKAVQYASGPLTLLNCNIQPEQIELLKVEKPEKRPEFLVQSMNYLVVGVKGTAPAGSRVEVVTANPPKPLPPGATDLNVRNAPAQVLRNGLTPLPKTNEPVVVRSWQIDADGKTVAAPEYLVRVVGPGMPGKVLGEVRAKPADAWCREKPNEPVATVEVAVK